MTARENTSQALQTLFKRVPSIRERAGRASFGQVSGALAIHDAVAKGKIHLAKFILDAVEGRFLVDIRDTHGKTPLIRAMRINDSDTRNKVVDLLISYNVNVNLLDNVGRSALSYACELSCNDTIRKLVQNNVDPNLEDNNGNTPLWYCAIVNNAAGIEIISRSFRRLGLEVDKINAEGMTPLMEAAKNGYLQCARLLTQEGKASLVARDVVRNMNAAEWAREGGCTTPEVEILVPKQRVTPHTAHHKAESFENAAKSKMRNGFDRAKHALPSLDNASRYSDPKSFLPYNAAAENGVASEKRHVVYRRKHASMEELSCTLEKRESENLSHDTAANRSTCLDVFNAGRQRAPIDIHHQILLRSQDLQGGPTPPLTPKPTTPSWRGSLFMKRPQPPALPRQPCSTAVNRPARRVNGAAGRSSNSMEDLLLMSDIIPPSPPNAHRSSSMNHLLMGQQSDTCGMNSSSLEVQSIDSETHIDLKIIPSERSGRRRTSSQPLPCSSCSGVSSDPLASVSCTHLPPISARHDL